MEIGEIIGAVCGGLATLIGAVAGIYKLTTSKTVRDYYKNRLKQKGLTTVAKEGEKIFRDFSKSIKDESLKTEGYKKTIDLFDNIGKEIDDDD